MKWYAAFYGSLRDPEGVRSLPGTYSRKDIFSRAQQAANETGRVVTVREEWGGPDGLWFRFYLVEPQLMTQEATL